MTSPTRRRRNELTIRLDAEADVARRRVEAEELKRAKQDEAEKSPFHNLTRGDSMLIRKAVKERWPTPAKNQEVIIEDLMRPIGGPLKDARLVISVCRTFLAMTETELQDRIKEDKQRVREERQQYRKFIKQQRQQNRVVIIEPKPEAAIATKSETEVSKSNHSEFSNTFTKEREVMSYGNNRTGNAAPATPAPPQWQDGFLLHPADDVQTGPRRNLHWRCEFMIPVIWHRLSRNVIETECVADMLSVRINDVTHETVVHFLQKHTRKIRVLQEWPHPMKPSEMVRSYKGYNGSASEFYQFTPEIVRRMLMMVCGYAEGDSDPEDVAAPNPKQFPF